MRKKSFWVIVLGIIVVMAGNRILNNPRDQETNIPNGPEVAEELRVEDYARMFVDQEIQIYQESFKIVDSKIIKLERLSTFDQILSYPIELWSIEYRLKPEDINEVKIAGGMEEIDGWLTEDRSMGKPILVFTYGEDKIINLGTLYTGEHNFDTLAEQERVVRIYLEEVGLLSSESYEGDHVVIKFPLSTGETSQLLLSQPTIHGDKGIWVAERWMDGNGNIYHEAPETDLTVDEYHENLQKKVDNGEDASLGDPVKVGYDFIINTLGQRLVKEEDLEVIKPALIEDFMEPPVSHYIGYITNFSLEDRIFHLDRVEFLGYPTS